MPEENQNQPGASSEEVVPDQPKQETPPETPPVADVSEERPPDAETPAKPDLDQKGAEEAAPPKTPEQIEADRKYFQDEAQTAKEKLRRIRDQYAEEPSTREEPPSQGAPDRDWLNQVDKLPVEELNERLRDDPVLQMQLQDYRDEQRLNRVLDERESKAGKRARYEAEAEATTRHLESFCDKHGIDHKQVFKIKDDLKEAGVWGSPAAIGVLIQDRLNAELGQQSIDRRGTEAAAKAARAAKTQTLTTQPDGGGPQVPVTEKSLEDKIADQFKVSGGTAAINKLFDN